MEKMRMIKIPTQGILFAKTVEISDESEIAPAIGAQMFERVKPQAFARAGLPKLVMLVDESGALKGLPVNPTGSELYGWRKHGKRIYGDVLIAKEVFTPDGWIEVSGLSEKEAQDAFSLMLSI